MIKGLKCGDLVEIYTKEELLEMDGVFMRSDEKIDHEDWSQWYTKTAQEKVQERDHVLEIRTVMSSLFEPTHWINDSAELPLEIIKRKVNKVTDYTDISQLRFD